MRVRIAARAAPRVIAGKTKCPGPPRPETGSHPRITEKTRISTGPSAKFGTERPKSVKTPMAWSVAVPRRWAASIPAGMPIAAQTTKATTASSSVAG